MEATSVANEHLKIEDLFPTAQELFRAPKRGGHPRLRLVVWVLLTAILALLGRKVRVWLKGRS